ncbi:MAG: MFS transporter [Candidatus Hodarchaeota archaeon]
MSKRTVISSLITTFFFNTIGMAIFSYIPPYLLALENEGFIAPLVSSIFPLTATIFPSLLGKRSDLIQNRSVFFIIGTIGTSLTLLLLLFVKELIWIIILLFLYGFFNTCFGIIFILYQEVVENNPKLISYYNAAVVLGWFAGSLFGGIFIDFYGILNIIWFLLPVSVISIVVLPFIKEDREMILEHYDIRSNQEVNNDIKQQRNKTISKSIYYGLFFRNFGVRPVMALFAITMSSYLIMYTQIGFLIGINPLLQFFLMILIGKIIKDKNQKIILVIGYLLGAFTLFGYVISIDFIGFLFYQSSASFSYAMFWNATQIYIAQRTTPKNKGKYIGYANSSFFLGSFIGGLIFSFLSINNDFHFAMWFMIIFPVISALIISLKLKIEKTSES